jgi:pre-mRNA-splicing factor SYF1
MIDLKIATPQIILNYSKYLEENKYFELSFRALEKGVNLFHYPQVYHIWVYYLIKFVKRYKSNKIERTRDLFEQSIKEIPKELAKNIYLLYGKFEEDFGQLKRAMQIYDRSIPNLIKEDQYQMFLIYINRATQYFGVSKTREIFDKAINVLDDKFIPLISLKYSNLERKLGEIDRSRAILIHSSTYSNPSTDNKFWDYWLEFERLHGNMDTAKEMLRIKRSVQNSFGETKIESNILANQANQTMNFLKRKRDPIEDLEENINYEELLIHEEELERKRLKN